MSRQVGIMKSVGTMGGNSFFYSRRGGFQMRQPAVGMGARVVKEPEFENTRRNASEFRTAAIVAGNMVIGIEDQFPGYLKGNVKADLTRVIRKLSEGDTENNWGSRFVPLYDMVKVQEELNRHSVWPAPEWYMNELKTNCFYDPVTRQALIKEDHYIREDYIEFLISIGASGIRTSSTVLAIVDQQYYLGQYTQIFPPYNYKFNILEYEYSTLEELKLYPIITAGQFGESFPLLNTSGVYSGQIVSITPYKIISGKPYAINKYRSICYYPWARASIPVSRGMKIAPGGLFGKLLNTK